MTIANAGDGEEDGNYEFTVDEAKGNIKLKNLDLSNRMAAINTSGIQVSD